MRFRRCVLGRAVVWIGFFLSSVLGPMDLQAQTPAARLIAQARAQLEELNVDSAATLLLEALEPEAGASEVERVRALVLVGIAELSSGMVWGAREAFRLALVLDPSLKVDSLSDLHSELLPTFSALVGEEVEGGVSSGVVEGTGPVDFTQTFLETAVDERPERLSGPSPRYPEVLRQAGIEGVVLLEFVIDTTGHVEAGTLKVLQSTNRAFEEPAKDVIRQSLYSPGRVRGQAVRVLVSQQIGFHIQR